MVSCEASRLPAVSNYSERPLEWEGKSHGSALQLLQGRRRTITRQVFRNCILRSFTHKDICPFISIISCGFLAESYLPSVAFVADIYPPSGVQKINVDKESGYIGVGRIPRYASRNPNCEYQQSSAIRQPFPCQALTLGLVSPLTR